jgi:microcin C transport system substrate-binding protein
MIDIVRMTRRDSLAIGAAALTSVLIPTARAAETPERHGISAFGDLKYPADFKQFDYVNPTAPKGGVFSQVAPTRIFNQGLLTFNSLNSFILKGDAAQGMEFTFASLMARAHDEPDAMYGLAAHGVQISPDQLTYRFLLRSGIKFHDGSLLTAHDVVFSLQVLKEKGHPIIQQMLQYFAGAQAPDNATVVVSIVPGYARDLPLFIGWLPIFSRAYYADRPFDETTLDVPLGCGPYKVGRFEPGRYIEYERVKEWWGADLPVRRGQNNFDIVRYQYYRDRDVALRTG